MQSTNLGTDNSNNLPKRASLLFRQMKTAKALPLNIMLLRIFGHYYFIQKKSSEMNTI